MLRQFLPLLAPPPETHDVMRPQSKTDRLRRKRPQKINARHMYIGALLKMSSEVKRGGRHVLADISSRIVRKHGSLWKAMPAENKRLYPMVAEQERFVKKQQIDDELQELRANLRLRRQRAATTKRVDGPLRMSTCA